MSEAAVDAGFAHVQPELHGAGRPSRACCGRKRAWEETPPAVGGAAAPKRTKYTVIRLPDNVYLPDDAAEKAADAADELIKLFRSTGPGIKIEEARAYLSTLAAAVQASGCEELVRRTDGKSLSNQRYAGTWIYDALEHISQLEPTFDDDTVPVEFRHAHTIVMLANEPDILECFYLPAV